MNTQQPRFRIGSLGIVAIIVVVLALWMLTGLFSHKAGPDEAAAAEQPAAAAPAQAFTVQVRTQSAEKIERLIQINGDTRPDKVVNIASQVEGQVVAVGPNKGARVAEHATLVQIDTRDLDAQFTEAKAMVRTRELEHAAAQKLRETGYVTEGELAARLAALEAARANARGIELRMLGLKIEAPVSGIIEDRMVEKGDYAKIGQAVIKLIKIDPLVVSVPVSEGDVASIHTGDAASAEVQGRVLRGQVRFVSAMADEKSRTFTVEIAVANPGSQIPAGLSARVSIPVQQVLAQRVPTSLLSLADNGDVGVKHVVGGKVVFSKAQIVRSEGDAVYMSGLPEKIDLITRGQGFVNAGEPVTTEAEPTATAATK